MPTAPRALAPFAVMLLALGCSSEKEAPPVDPCAKIVCAAAGTTCSPDDGLCHCGSGPVCADGERCDLARSACTTLPEAVCNPGTSWSAGLVAFRDATDDWGLSALSVQGTRVAVLDGDGDGFADLFVRRGGNGADDFADGATRRSWLLRNTGGAGFEDVTMSSGVRQTRADQGSMGRPGEVVAFADVDGDGDLDVYTGMSTGVDGALAGETSEIMLNDGSGHFAFGPESSAVRRAGQVDIPAGASFVDFDRDGNVDLWIGQHNYAPAGTQNTVFRGDHLYRGDGTGAFTEVTTQAGLTTVDWVDLEDLDTARAHSRAWSALACDLNGDGTPELLTASYGRAPNHLWKGQRADGGEVTYQNASVASGYAYDADLDWTTNEFAKCYCQANRTAEGCDVAPAPRIQCAQPNWQHQFDRRPFRLGGNSGTTVCADVNNDGAMDLFTTEITHWWAGLGADRSELLLNTGESEPSFTRPGLAASGLERGNPVANWDNGDMTAAVFDFDNDGWPDVFVGASDYPGNHGLLFHQTSPGMFEAVPIDDGIDHNRSHGVAVADFDRDGDLDLLVGHSRARCDASAPNDCYASAQVRLFENVLGDQGNFIQLDLAGGPGTNRAAIGARVQVRAGSATQTQEVGGGHGHYGLQHDRVLHFGLGADCEAEVTVRWPNAALDTQTFTVVSGHRYRVVQGEAPEAVTR